MFERFTRQARQAVVRAQEECRRLQHPHIGTEHVLLGILAEGGGAGARALRGLGLSFEGVRETVVRRTGVGPIGLGEEEAEALQAIGIDLDEVRRTVEETFGPNALERSSRRWIATGHIPFTAPSKKALELALREAVRLGNRHIGTEHLLLGLVRDERSEATELLLALGVTPARVRDAITEEIARGGDPPGRTA